MHDNTGYELSISIREGILEIVITGEVTKAAVGALHTDVIGLVQENDAKAVLCDISALMGYHDEFAAVYFRVRSIPPDVPRLPSAVVDLSKNTAYTSFYETTAANAGLSVKWFTDIEAARAWLRDILCRTG